MITKDFIYGHSNRVKCSANFVLFKFHKPCKRKLSCGHPCKELCHEPCKCKEIVSEPLPCGHIAKMVHCWKSPSDIKCKEKCRKILSCGHRCSGDCHSCYLGQLHVSCKSCCGRTLPCGHSCEFPCTNECPPCSKSCQNYCNHSECTRKCNEPCIPCVEECQWKCKHYKCKKQCGKMCDRPSCNHPCPKLLRCCHPCIGLCGEKCPCWCRVCDKKLVTKIFFGTEDNLHAHFIELEDCGHILEVTGLDQWMDQQDSTTDSKVVKIQFKCCPKCKTSVHRSLRYSNIIKQTLRDTEEVKKRMNGTGIDCKDMFKSIRDSFCTMSLHRLGKVWRHSHVIKTFNTIESRVQYTDYSKEANAVFVQMHLTPHDINTLLFQAENLPRVFDLLNGIHKFKKIFDFDAMKIHIKDV